MKAKPERAHGTRVKYVHDRCRCFACRVAATNYETDRMAKRRALAPWVVRYVPPADAWYVRNQLTGEIGWKGGPGEQAAAYEVRDSLNAHHARHEADQDPLWADAAKVREVKRHVRRLQEAGIGLRRIAEQAGVGRTRLVEIVNDASYNKARPKKRRLKFETAERILALFPIDAKPAPAALVPAAETRRLIGELLTAGLTRGAISLALGNQTPALQLRYDRVQQRNADAVRALHDTAFRVSSRLRAVCRCPEWQP